MFFLGDDPAVAAQREVPHRVGHSRLDRRSRARRVPRGGVRDRHRRRRARAGEPRLDRQHRALRVEQADGRRVMTAGPTVVTRRRPADRRRGRRPRQIIAAMREIVGRDDAPPGRRRRRIRRDRQLRDARAVRPRLRARSLAGAAHAGGRLGPRHAAPELVRRGGLRRADGRSRTSPTILRATGCYERRAAAVREVIPQFGDGWRFKIVLPSCVDRRPLPALLARRAVAGRRDASRRGCPAQQYLAIVAATNFKQRTRKMLEYFHADRLNYAVLGTPNRLEYDQGFFVKLGDGAADVKPIAHLYKTPGLPAGRVPRRARGDPRADADDGHLLAAADAGRVLLLAAARQDGPLPVRA